MNEKTLFKFVSVALMMVVLSACGTLTVNGEVLDPTQYAAVEEEQTASTREAAKPVVDDSAGEDTISEPSSAPSAAAEVLPDVVYEGLSFSYDDLIASDVLVEDVPAVTQDTPGEMMTPAYIRATFEGYTVPNTFHTPRIFIYPADELAAVNERAAQRIESLRMMLAERPAQAPSGGFETEPLPFLPMFNAGQVLRTQIAYLDFQNGSGVRYLTQYDQAYLPINNNELFYTFQGLTDDGTYYVSAILPVVNQGLPSDAQGMDFTGDEQEAFINSFDTYIQNIAQQLNEQGPANFTPDLSLLDALIASLLVQ